VWRANVFRLVEESDDLVVGWTPPGAERWIPVDDGDREIRIPQDDWRLGVRRTRLHSLVLIRSGRFHSVWLFWEHERFLHWYVNFEEPLGPTRLGFDYKDWKLDLIVDPDGTRRWKDEDELEDADRQGIVDADTVWGEAERVVADPPWPTGWEDWRPDPSWPVPRFPNGWDVV
jgi:hypothetical protein